MSSVSIVAYFRTMFHEAMAVKDKKNKKKIIQKQCNRVNIIQQPPAKLERECTVFDGLNFKAGQFGA